MTQDRHRPPLNAFMQSIALLIIRIGFGTLLIYSHGWMKVANFGEMFDRFANPIGLGSGLSLSIVVFVEIVCAGLVVIGLFTRIAVIPILIEMLILVFIVHVDDPWGRKELPLLFFSGFLALFIAGGGWYSADNILRRRKRRGAAPATTLSGAASASWPGEGTTGAPSSGTSWSGPTGGEAGPGWPTSDPPDDTRIA